MTVGGWLGEMPVMAADDYEPQGSGPRSMHSQDLAKYLPLGKQMPNTACTRQQQTAISCKLLLLRRRLCLFMFTIVDSGHFTQCHGRMAWKVRSQGYQFYRPVPHLAQKTPYSACWYTSTPAATNVSALGMLSVG